MSPRPVVNVTTISETANTRRIRARRRGDRWYFSCPPISIALPHAPLLLSSTDAAPRYSGSEPSSRPRRRETGPWDLRTSSQPGKTCTLPPFVACHQNGLSRSIPRDRANDVSTDHRWSLGVIGAEAVALPAVRWNLLDEPGSNQGTDLMGGVPMCRRVDLPRRVASTRTLGRCTPRYGRAAVVKTKCSGPP